MLMNALDRTIAAIDIPLKQRTAPAPVDVHLESLVNKVQFAVGTKPASNENILEGLNVLHSVIIIGNTSFSQVILWIVMNRCYPT